MGYVEELASGRFKAVPRDPRDGRRLTLADCRKALGPDAATTLTFDTELSAEAFVARVEQAISRAAAGLHVLPGAGAEPRRPAGPRLSEHFTDLVARNTWAKGTLNWYRTNVAHLVREMDDPRLETLADDPRIVERYIAGLITAGVSPDQVNARITTLRRICRDAYKWRVITVDPTLSLSKVNSKTEPHRILDEDEFEALLAAAPFNRRAMLLLAYDSGLRREELAGLHLHRVDLLHEVVTVVEVTEADGALREWSKGARNRTVPLTRRTQRAIQDLLSVQPVPPTACLFRNRDGERITDLRALTRSFSGWVREARIEKPLPTLHDLRHSYGTRLARAGVPIADIAKLMGHADLATTQVYIDAAVPDAAKAWVRFALEGGERPLPEAPRIGRDTR